MQVEFHSQTVDGVEMFYRVAGPADAPVMLLQHGFPTASHMFRDLIPVLAETCRVIAPDLPGFGNTKAPPRGEYAYSFDGLAKTIDAFTEALHLARFALCIFDYGAPVGLRVAMAHPERITAIISQNHNAYLEGLSEAWAPWRTYRASPTAEHRKACRASPDGYTLDIAYMARPGAADIQLDLILDYGQPL